MKKIIVIVLFSLLIPNLVSAYIQSGLDIGGEYNPIYMQEVKDPYEVQRTLNTQKENNLKSTYGISSYYSCSSANSSSCGVSADIGNPYNQASCLSIIQYCLESKSIKENYSKEWNQSCKDSYGIYSKLESVDDVNGNYNCGCQDGYSWSEDKTQCIRKVIKTNDQICKDYYGLNSFFLEIDPSDNKTVCDCESGYQWNEQNTGCVVAPALPTKTNDQICNENYPNSYYNGVLNGQGGLTCDCKTGYVWEGNVCILAPTVTPYVSKVKKEIIVPDVQEEPIIKEKTKSGIFNETSLASVSLVKETATTTEKMKSKNLWQKIRSWFSFWK